MGHVYDLKNPVRHSEGILLRSADVSAIIFSFLTECAFQEARNGKLRLPLQLIITLENNNGSHFTEYHVA